MVALSKWFERHTKIQEIGLDWVIITADQRKPQSEVPYVVMSFITMTDGTNTDQYKPGIIYTDLQSLS